MGEKRLNGLMVLHVHKDKNDDLDVIKVANLFSKKAQSRGLTFGKFTFHDLCRSTKTRTIGIQTE